MLRVLLVDDEPLSIRYLKNMISWNELGFEIVGEAANGRKALELFEKFEPHIVLSDIKMPLMDGVELSAELRKQSTGVKIILISAYQDFEYAKQALRHNVSNYLLKHELNAETLQAELEQVKGQINKERTISELSRANFFKDILYGKEMTEWPFKNEHPMPNRYMMMAIRKRTFLIGDLSVDKPSKEHADFLWDVMVNAVRNMSFGVLEYLAGLTIDQENQLLLFRVETNSMKEIYDDTHMIYRTLCHQAERFDRNGINVICSDIIAIKNMSETFRRMSYATRFTMFMDKGAMLYLHQIPIVNPDPHLHIQEELTALEECLRLGKDSCVLFLNALFKKVTEPIWNLTELKYLIRNLDSMLAWLEKKQGICIGIAMPVCVTVWEACDYYRRCIEAAQQKLKEQNVAAYSKVIQELIYYIHEHYSEDITLDTAGRLCSMNGVYLGQLFRKEVGISLAKYLTKFRIEQARRLLEDGTYTVAQIGEMVGYQTSQYFSQTFRKTTGITPQNYKNGERRK